MFHILIIDFGRYDGRVLIVRRTDDEMICVPDNSLAGNRGNNLLEKLLARRYPKLFENCTESFAILEDLLSASTFSGRRKLLSRYRFYSLSFLKSR